MMMAKFRHDTSILGQWWWRLDHWQLGAILLLSVIGFVMILSSSPSVALDNKYPQWFYAWRQLLFLCVSIPIMLCVSMLSVKSVKRLGMIMTVVGIVLMLLMVEIATDAKGAARWLPLGPFKIQPSEFVKTGFIILTAWLFKQYHLRGSVKTLCASATICALIITILSFQPDVGMAFLVFIIWIVQFFIAGMSAYWIIILGGLFILGCFGAYFAFSHVQLRVDRFLDPAGVLGYQEGKSIASLRSGGVFGRGPGEGTVKSYLPDSHADFIFSVLGEEFGLFACLFLLGLFLFIILRSLYKVRAEENLFIVFAVSGLMVQIAVQMTINIASALNMIPPKGITLPFVSYGGSSMLATAIAFGMVLALTHTKPENFMQRRSKNRF